MSYMSERIHKKFSVAINVSMHKDHWHFSQNFLHFKFSTIDSAANNVIFLIATISAPSIGYYMLETVLVLSI